MNLTKHRWSKDVALAPWLWPAAILLSALGAGLVVFGDVQSPLRPAIALWFLAICPGMAFVRLLRIRDTLTELTLAIALSLALDAIIAGAMAYARAWSPTWGLAVLIGLSIVGAALQLVRPRGPVDTTKDEL
ncbi:MAG TPA: hypothetical protein VF897_23245 [Roseiflexaceae bacterium]